jgi:hypothetical protein
MAMAL